jgi:hypothetical protein
MIRGDMVSYYERGYGVSIHIHGFIFDLCLSEIHIYIYINDICIKFSSRISVAHSIPEHSFSIKNTKMGYGVPIHTHGSMIYIHIYVHIYYIHIYIYIYIHIHP